MSNAVYPSLPGLAFDVRRVPMFKTITHEAASGREYRGFLMGSPRYRYILTYDILTDNGSWLDGFRTLLGFYNARKGSYDDWFFTDPDDYAAGGSVFGTGDGSTKTFQLARTLGASSEPVYDLNGAPAISVAGVLKSTPGDYTVGSSGLVTFVSAPANGASLTWTGSFYWRCRFEADELEFTKFMHKLWEAREVSFKTVLP
jgi:uncharacterized protein (TIGR02217 family)